MQVAQVKRSRISLLWILPIIALGVGIYLAYVHISNTGPIITIQFKTAEGLEAGKTLIRYKELNIGTITELTLDDDLTGVTAKAQMTHNALPLLRKDSTFWVVKPRVSASGVSGLSTLISGSYIAIDPGTSKDSAVKFVASDVPVLTPSSTAGIHVRLVTGSPEGLNIGSPVYYRGFKVGQLEQIRFDDTFKQIYVDAFITAPFDKLVTNQTKFWNTSGIDVNLSPRGLDISASSLETVLLGGISFTTPTSTKLTAGSDLLDKEKIFTLYASEQATHKPSSVNRENYVLYFPEDIRGLQVGASVEFNGIRVGEVSDIRLLYDAKEKRAIVPVIIALDSNQAHIVNITNPSLDSKNVFSSLIASAGLHASLETSNVLTGEKYVRLALSQVEDNYVSTKDHYSSYMIMPTQPSSIAQITDDVSSILKKIKSLPIEELVNEANKAIENANQSILAINTLVSSQEIQKIGKTLENSLSLIDTVSKKMTNSLGKFDKGFTSIEKQLESTLYSIGSESSLYFNLQNTLNALQKMANSINVFMKKLDAKPNALIWGE